MVAAAPTRVRARQGLLVARPHCVGQNSRGSKQLWATWLEPEQKGPPSTAGPLRWAQLGLEAFGLLGQQPGRLSLGSFRAGGGWVPWAVSRGNKEAAPQLHPSSQSPSLLPPHLDAGGLRTRHKEREGQGHSGGLGQQVRVVGPFVLCLRYLRKMKKGAGEVQTPLPPPSLTREFSPHPPTSGKKNVHFPPSGHPGGAS